MPSNSNVCYSCCYGYCYKAQSNTPIQLNFELKLAFDLLSPANQTLPQPLQVEVYLEPYPLKKS